MKDLSFSFKRHFLQIFIVIISSELEQKYKNPTPTQYLSNKGRNMDNLYNSLQKSLRSPFKSGESSKAKFSEVKPRVYNHLSPMSAHTQSKVDTNIPSFTPKITYKSRILKRNETVSNLLYKDALRRKEVENIKKESQEHISRHHKSKSPSKSINDKILWRNLEQDLVNSVHYNELKEPMTIEDIELILRDIGMLTVKSQVLKSNMIGKAKEKMLLTKMNAMLTSNAYSNISFENLLVFLATVINIEVPYKDKVKRDYLNSKKLNFNASRNDNLFEENSDSQPINQHIEMRMSEGGLLDLLPDQKADNDLKTPRQKSKYKYG